GDDYVDTQLISAPHHFGGADTGIHADDQLDALRGGSLHYLRPHAVTIFEAVRNVIAGSAPGQFDGLGEEHHRGGAIDVVIAVDENLLLTADGFPETRESLRHAAQKQRVMQIVERGMEESPRRGRVVQSPMYHDLGRQRAGGQRGAERSYAVRLES